MTPPGESVRVNRPAHLDFPGRVLHHQGAGHRGLRLLPAGHRRGEAAQFVGQGISIVCGADSQDHALLTPAPR